MARSLAEMKHPNDHGCHAVDHRSQPSAFTLAVRNKSSVYKCSLMNNVCLEGIHSEPRRGLYSAKQREPRRGLYSTTLPFNCSAMNEH